MLDFRRISIYMYSSHLFFTNTRSNARLASGVRKSRENYFKTDVFLFSTEDPHICHFVWNHNSQQTKNMFQIGIIIDSSNFEITSSKIFFTKFLSLQSKHQLASACEWVPKMINFYFQETIADDVLRVSKADTLQTEIGQRSNTDWMPPVQCPHTDRTWVAWGRSVRLFLSSTAATGHAMQIYNCLGQLRQL